MSSKVNEAANAAPKNEKDKKQKQNLPSTKKQQ